MTKILVIDDDVPVAELIAVVLQEANFRVVVLHRLSDVPSERFDCIVTDLIDVDPYSYEAARDWILRLADRFPVTPVVIVTGRREARDDRERLGAPVLIKPFDIEDLVSAVREATG